MLNHAILIEKMKSKQQQQQKKTLELIQLGCLKGEKYFSGLFIQLWIFFSDKTLKRNKRSSRNSGVVKFENTLISFLVLVKLKSLTYALPMNSFL